MLLHAGYYMYIETSSPRSKGHKAWLISSQFKSTNGRCLQFWYHMYGATIGTLNVLLLQNNTRSSPIWSLSSNQGNMWRIAQVTLRSLADYSVSVCQTNFKVFNVFQLTWGFHKSMTFFYYRQASLNSHNFPSYLTIPPSQLQNEGKYTAKSFLRSISEFLGVSVLIMVAAYWWSLFFMNQM